MMEIIRDHDKLYLDEDRKLNPKEYFKFIAQHVEPFLKEKENLRILDIGCATGDFVHYLQTLYPQAHITGMDVMQELLERAQKECPTVNFITGDIADSSSLPEERYDAVFLNGVHSIFDDIEPWLDNVVTLLDKKTAGRAYVFGMFNPKDYDVLVKVRPSSTSLPWQSGWNCFSKKSVFDYLSSKNVTAAFYDFQIGIDIPEKKEDGLRSWTFKLEDKSRYVVNGTQVLHHFSLLEIKPY